MTVIAAVARNGRITMAADHLTTFGDWHILAGGKIARLPVDNHHDEVLLGTSGSGAAYDLVVARWDPPPTPPDHEDLAAALRWAGAVARWCTAVVADETVRSLVDDGDGTQSVPRAYLLGWNGRLYYLLTNAAVAVPDGIAALGQGAQMALGVLHTSAVRHDPVAVTTQAVQLACQHHTACAVTEEGPDLEVLDADDVVDAEIVDA